MSYQVKDFVMFQEPYMRKIVALVGIMAVVALLAYTYSTVKEARYMYQGPTSISVTGIGEVSAKPDLATFNFTIEAKEADATTAQNKVSDIEGAILAYLKEAGVDEKDVKTANFDLSPRYEYPQTVCTQWGCPPATEPKLIGYQMSETVTVKVRDAGKAGELIAGVGSKGAINISGLSFTIDDDEVQKAEARKAAIADAKEKAEVLAESLGVRIVRMNGYWEEQNGMPMPYGVGGDMMKSESAMMAPRAAQIPSGENTYTVQVNISYEID
jgi:uncharacterized protein YggE